MTDNWNIEVADQFYGISKWGNGYFGVNKKGELTAYPELNKLDVQISIKDIIDEIISEGIELPVVIRFQDILRARVKELNKSFRSAIRSLGYCGTYKGVYPVKVNQMREVVEEVVDSGADFDFGLEAGSKSELMTILALNTNANSLSILNGYKDEQYIRLALIGSKIGRNIVIVVEKPSELDLIIKLAKETKTRPMLGIRSKLSFKGSGKWENSAGDNAKFGLSTTEIIQAVNKLKQENFLDCLKLFHFHIGSQIPVIGTIQDAISEGARFYAQLVKMGAPLEYFDVGGGLGVDYDGSQSSNESSINYSMEEYAKDVVKSLMQICDGEDVDHPTIVSESGRAITAHHSCVITKVIGEINPGNAGFENNESENEHLFVQNMRQVAKEVSEDNFMATFNTISKIKEDTLNAFKLGVLNLEDRAKVEDLYWKTLKNVFEIAKEVESTSEIVWELRQKLSSQYLCNFSVFQSTADSWAIKQVLPVVPITRLDEYPSVEGSIADITCDSDGKICHFYNENEPSNTTRFHALKQDEDYYLGIFMTGAYQDVMGDMHNLFGRLNEVHVYSDDDDPTDFYIEEVIRGQKSSQVLKTMQYNPQLMAMMMKKEIDRQVTRGLIPPREGVRLIDFYEENLYRYTYLK